MKLYLQPGTPLLGARVEPVGAQVLLGQRRREQAARPELVRPHHVQLHRVQRDLRLQVQPGDQAEHDPECPVQRGVAGQLVPDDVAAEQLQCLPGDGGDDGAKQQVPGSHLSRGGKPEGKPEHGGVEHQGDRDGGNVRTRAGEQVRVAGDRRQEDGDDLGGSDYRDQAEAAQQRPGKAGTPEVGHLPGGVQRVLGGARDSLRAKKRAEPGR